MDALSHVVSAMTLGRPRSFVVEGRAPWGRRYASVRGAGIHVVLEGEALLLQEDRQSVRLGTGDVLLLPGGAAHGLASAPDVPLLALDDEGDDASPGVVVLGPDGTVETGQTSRMLCGTYRFDSLRRHPLLRQLPQVVHLPARLGERSDLSAVTAMLGRELTQAAPGTGIAVEALLDLLFVTTLRTWFDQHPDQSWAAALDDPRIAEALRLMHTRPDHPWTVAELACQVGLSRALFARRFTQQTGQPPLGYLTAWRMTMAARLLRDEHLGLGHVARAVGYASSYAFANAFKREVGVPPGTFRRDHAPVATVG